ncbi:MAG: hypothetical protein AAGF95_07800 [Chloroflexota bacterium]
MSSTIQTHLVRLAIVEGAVLLIGVCIQVIWIAFGYRGTCGGLLPFISSPRPCSWLEYMQDMLSLVGGLTLAALISWYGVIVMLIVLLIPAVCYVLVGQRSLVLAIALSVAIFVALSLTSQIIM